MVAPRESPPAKKPKFEVGRLVSTPGALDALTNDELLTALSRHVCGDWGDLCEEDRIENEVSLRMGFRLFSVYRSSAGVKFYIITEADRSVTTVLLPEEY